MHKSCETRGRARVLVARAKGKGDLGQLSQSMHARNGQMGGEWEDEGLNHHRDANKIPLRSGDSTVD
jgi:hypothetical protein